MVDYAVLSLAFLRAENQQLDADLFIVGDVDLEVIKNVVKEEESK